MTVAEKNVMNAPPSTWAKEAGEWAKQNNISDGTFLKQPATREEIITMLYRLSKL
jgi:peptidoglycan LD-endopeptidase CwlK